MSHSTLNTIHHDIQYQNQTVFILVVIQVLYSSSDNSHQMVAMYFQLCPQHIAILINYSTYVQMGTYLPRNSQPSTIEKPCGHSYCLKSRYGSCIHLTPNFHSHKSLRARILDRCFVIQVMVITLAQFCQTQ